MAKLCTYCGYTVEFIPGKSTTICRACGRENTLTLFERPDQLKASEEEKTRIEEQLRKTNADKEKLSAELFHALENLDTINVEQKSGNDKLDALTNALRKSQDQTDDALHELFTAVAQGAERQTEQLNKLNNLSEKLLSAQGDMYKKAMLMPEIVAEIRTLKLKSSQEGEALASFFRWGSETHEQDAVRLETIRDASAELLRQCEALDGQLTALTAQQQALEKELTGFHSEYTENKRKHLSKLYHNAEDLQTAKHFADAEKEYRQVIIDGGDEPEVYWRVIMCHYGLEFIQDEGESERKLTMYMPDLTPADEMPEQRNLIASLKDAPEAVWENYKARLNEINRIIDTYREIRFDKPYDVFISVKQNDNGRQTTDSDKASDLYDLLKGWGLEVFNSRRTELIPGMEFEPQIISALMSAKVMIVVGTKPEYMEAKWVRNEWHRFQWLRNNDNEKKRLLFCYLVNMQPSDMPKALNPNIQAILEGVNSQGKLRNALAKAFPENEKLNPKKESKGTDESGKESKQETHISAAAPLVKRALLFLEMKNWERADEYCEKALDIDPENAQAYLCKLMLDMKVSMRDDLSIQTRLFDKNENYIFAVRFGDDELRRFLTGATDSINQRIAEEERKREQQAKEEQKRKQLEEERKHLEEERKQLEEERKQPEEERKHNTLMADKLHRGKYTPKDNYKVLGSRYSRPSIKSIHFENTLQNMPRRGAWDVSEQKKGGVMAWVENGCDLHIAANGTIHAGQDCSSLFRDYSQVSQIDFNGCFDTSKVTDMSCMFFQCSSLTSLDVSGFDTSKVTDMSCMFYQCSSLTSLDVSGFDTSKVTDMRSMFYQCSSLTSLDVSGFDTSKVTDMRSMFYQCSSLTSLDLSGFDTSSVTNMYAMFCGCSSLTSLNVSGFDTSKVTNMRSMFGACSSLTSLNVSGFDTSKVTYMSWMFGRCSSLTSLDVSGFKTGAVSNHEDMFTGCNRLGLSWEDVGKPGRVKAKCNTLMADEIYWQGKTMKENYKVLGSRYSRPSITSIRFENTLQNLPRMGAWDVSAKKNGSVMAWVENGCVLHIAADGKIYANENSRCLFNGYTNVRTIDFNGCFDTSKVTDMGGMFGNCFSLTSLDVSGFDTSKVTDMGGMFNNCSFLTSLDVSGFKTRAVFFENSYVLWL